MKDLHVLLVNPYEFGNIQVGNTLNLAGFDDGRVHYATHLQEALTKLFELIPRRNVSVVTDVVDKSGWVRNEVGVYIPNEYRKERRMPHTEGLIKEALDFGFPVTLFTNEVYELLSPNIREMIQAGKIYYERKLPKHGDPDVFVERVLRL